MTVYKVIRELCTTYETEVEADSPGEAELRAALAVLSVPLAHGEWRTKDIIRITPRGRLSEGK